MIIYVKTLTGATVTIDVSEDDRIRHIMWQVEDKEGIPCR